jgi:geranylgeranyl diphosphate synthase, type I
MNPDEVKALLEKYQADIQGSLEKILPRKYTKETLGEVVNGAAYELDVEAVNKTINDPLWDLFDRGGKRWRPILFLTIVEVLNGDPKKFIDLATVFEVIHNGTLVVDDFEDQSEKRRGKSTLHLLYGGDVAINAGNVIYFLPLKVFDNLDISDQQKLLTYQIYVNEMVNLGFGQAIEIAWHKGLVDTSNITERSYLQMCAFKTGGLARMAAKIAAMVSGADQMLIDKIGKFTESLGIVFQIQDDILNITVNELSDKKGIGDDITEGKRSLPVIYALKNLSEQKSKRLMDILLSHTNDKALMLEAIYLIREGKGIEESQVVMEKLSADAWMGLEPLLTAGEKKDKLFQLANFLIDRQV